jgi:uncharacterized protein YjbI with pentapeptide repeats
MVAERLERIVSKLKDKWLTWAAALTVAGKDNRLAWALAALVLTWLLMTTILGYLLNWEWTGLVGIPEHSETRLGWDWLELLIIPIVLGAGALWFNQRARKGEQEQRQNELKIANDQRHEDTLQRYLDRMSELVLDKYLRESKRDDAVRAMARARTLTVLRSLDGNRKGQVVRFLHEADLIGKVAIEKSEERHVIEAIIDLGGADLRGAILSVAILSGAILRDANLRDANLRFANLSNANLTEANLSYAILNEANLSGAALIRADLSGAALSGASLRDADLSYANLSGANLRDADLSDALLSRRQLAQAVSLVGATLPDGRVIETEEAWEEFKKRWRRINQD